MASVCRSLQCLISTLTQVSGGGVLFRFACSVMLWGGRGTVDKYHWPVWGGPAVFRPHWVCPLLMACVLSPSTLLRLQVSLQGVGPKLCALARPKLLRFSFLGTTQRHRLSWTCVLCLPQPEQLKQPGACRAHSPRVRCTLSPPRPQPQFPRLPVGCTLRLF